VACNGGLLARCVGLSDLEQSTIYAARILHDIGKMAISPSILTKPGPLTAAERVEMQRHTTLGANMILGVSATLRPIADGVRAHHERWDGSGYPNGFSGGEIPIAGRILAISDVFDALTHPRSYRASGRTSREAFEHILTGAGEHFDPTLTECFAGLYRQGSIAID
jgi:putative two-component system response regulator